MGEHRMRVAQGIDAILEDDSMTVRFVTSDPDEYVTLLALSAEELSQISSDVQNTLFYIRPLNQMDISSMMQQIQGSVMFQVNGVYRQETGGYTLVMQKLRTGEKIAVSNRREWVDLLNNP